MGEMNKLRGKLVTKGVAFCEGHNLQHAGLLDTVCSTEQWSHSLYVPESSTEKAAVMTRKYTNTNSKVVIVYLQETTHRDRIYYCEVIITEWDPSEGANVIA